MCQTSTTLGINKFKNFQENFRDQDVNCVDPVELSYIVPLIWQRDLT